jgi:hypothetical protein
MQDAHVTGIGPDGAINERDIHRHKEATLQHA